MSHIYDYDANIKDRLLFMEAAKKIGATRINIGAHTITQYGSNTVSCIASCLLPGWKYPIGVDEKGTIKYDHWGSEANSMGVLEDCIQQYWRQGVNQTIDWSLVDNYHEEKLENGDLQIVLEIN